MFFGSARVDSRERAERALRTLRARGVHDAREHYEQELTKTRKALEWAPAKSRTFRPRRPLELR